MSIQPKSPKPKGYKEMPYTGPRRKRNPNVKPARPKSKDKNKIVAPLKPKRPGMGGPTGKPAPKVKIPSMIDAVIKPKPKYTPLPRKITPRRTPKIGGR